LIYVRVGHTQHLESKKIRKSSVEYKGLSILIPCYNNVKDLKVAIAYLKKIKYPNLEIIFINDGSTDHTMDKFKYLLELEKESSTLKSLNKTVKEVYKSKTFKNIYVVDKEHENRSYSLDLGTELSSKEYLVTIGANSILKQDALFLLNMNLQNEDVIATSGSIMIKQGIDMDADGKLTFKSDCKFIEYAQFMEYIATFNIIRNSMSKANSLTIVSSDFGVYKKEVISELKCFKNKKNTSMDISLQLNKYAKEKNKKITYDDRAICFKDGCSDVFSCCLERMSYQSSFISSLKKHIKFLVSGCFTSKLFFLAFFNTIILGYISIILILSGIGYLIISIFMDGYVSIDTYLQIILGAIIFIFYSIINIRCALNNNLSFKNIKKHKIILIHLYILIIYKPIMMFTFIYTAIKKLFGREYICKCLKLYKYE
jgi:glycosyltransferase involved in cell wall biosynthesis